MVAGMTELATPKVQPEDLQARYARHTRNAVVFIAWAVGITAAFAVIFGLIVGLNVINLDHALSTTVNTSPTCSNDPLSSLPNC